jgi:hypothetical protein
MRIKPRSLALFFLFCVLVVNFCAAAIELAKRG